MYRCEATTVEGFVQQLANLFAKGYRWHVVATVPPRKDPADVDAKLVELYKLDVSRGARYRRKQAGRANVAYLRHGRTFVLTATDGHHRFFEEHPLAKDARREPVLFHGYSIGSGRGSDGKFHASVRIEPGVFVELLATFRELAAHRSAETLAGEFRRLRFSPFARVRRQYLRLLREVNEIRGAAGYEQLPYTVLRLRRVPVKVYADDQSVNRRPADTALA